MTLVLVITVNDEIVQIRKEDSREGRGCGTKLDHRNAARPQRERTGINQI
jgi:hypothetical protein